MYFIYLTYIVCQGILLPLCMHQQNNDSMSMHFISTLYASTKQRQYVNAFYFHSVCINKTMTVCQCILFPLCMHQQNNDSMSMHFISTLYASKKQRQYVNAFYFHSVCINKTMTVCQCILFPLCIHQQNNDSMSMHFTSTLCASTKQ